MAVEREGEGGGSHGVGVWQESGERRGARRQGFPKTELKVGVLLGAGQGRHLGILDHLGMVLCREEAGG